jgi:heme A synthase
MKLSAEAKTLPVLLALAYLGFYVWGLAMSVFTPVELGAFSIVAAGCVIFFAAAILVARRSPETPEMRHKANNLRETRGF